MRRCIFVLLLTSMFIILYSDDSIYVKGETLNVRESPDGEKIGVVNYGTEMETIKKEGKWVKVKIEGWVWEPLTSSEKPQKENLPEKKIVKSKTYRIVMWASSLYSGAGSNNSKIGSLKKGEKLEILKEKNLTFSGITVPWYYVMKNNGKKGWVCDADLELP